MGKKGGGPGGYAGKRILWVVCREAGYQLYRLLLGLFKGKGR